MILRVVPPAPGLTILFTLSFPSLPNPLPFPPAWSAALSLALAHNLPAPPSAHALDRACSTVELLHSVTFDIAHARVECRVIDDQLVTLPLHAELARALQRVIDDVARSSAELEAEKLGLAPGARTPPQSPLPDTPSEPSSPSLLALLSSFLPSFTPASGSSSGSSTPNSVSSAHSRPSHTRSHSLLLTPPTPLSRAYRRLARSTLVDAFARWVQPELARSVGAKGQGGWAAAAARNALRKASAELDELLAASEPEPPSPAPSTSSCASDFPALPPTPALSSSSAPPSPTSPTSPSPSPSPSLSTAQLSGKSLAAYSRLATRVQEMRGVLATLEEREREWREGEGLKRVRLGVAGGAVGTVGVEEPARRWRGRSALGLYVVDAETLSAEPVVPAPQLQQHQQSKSKISFPSLPALPLAVGLPSSLPPPPSRPSTPPSARFTLAGVGPAPTPLLHRPRERLTRNAPFDPSPPPYKARAHPHPHKLTLSTGLARRKAVPTAFRIPADGEARVMVVGEDADEDEDGDGHDAADNDADELLAQRFVGVGMGMDVDVDEDLEMELELGVDVDVDCEMDCAMDIEVDVVDVVMCAAAVVGKAHAQAKGMRAGRAGRRNALDLPRAGLLEGW